MNWYQSVFTTRLSENSGQIIMATSVGRKTICLAASASHFKGDPRLTVLRFLAITSSGKLLQPELARGPLVPELKKPGIPARSQKPV